MGRPRYDDAYKARAVDLAVEHGPAEAARQLGIKAGTLRSWCSLSEVTTVTPERTRQTAAATEARRLAWEQRRSELVHRIGEVAEHALNVTEAMLCSGETRKASDASAVVARLVDKAQLLSGGHTARFGTDADRTQVLTEAHDKGLSLVTDAA